MQTNKNITSYAAAAALFVLLKFGFTFAASDHLLFLLKPIDKLVELFTGSHSVYLAGNGFYHASLNMLIDKSCAGFNFWLLSFLVFVYLAIKYCDKTAHKIAAIPSALLAAYVLTIFANTSRIFVSIFTSAIVQNHAKIFFANREHIVHEVVGIVTNVSFLVLAYYLTEKFFIRRRRNAKLT